MPVFFWLGLLRGGYASQVFILKWEMFIPIKKWQAALPKILGKRVCHEAWALPCGVQGNVLQSIPGILTPGLHGPGNT